MTAKLEVYKCLVCGNIVEVVHDGQGELVCCGQPMNHLVENSVDADAYLHELQRAGYATDPAYANKVSDIIKRDSFVQTVADLKVSGDFRG